MDKSLHDFDKLFREKVEAMQGSPDKHIWENIEQQLDKDDATLYKRKFITFRRLSVCLLVLFAGFATFTVIHTNSLNHHLQQKKDLASINRQKEYNNVNKIDNYKHVSKSNKVLANDRELLIEDKTNKQLTQVKNKITKNLSSYNLIKENGVVTMSKITGAISQNTTSNYQTPKRSIGGFNNLLARISSSKKKNDSQKRTTNINNTEASLISDSISNLSQLNIPSQFLEKEASNTKKQIALFADEKHSVKNQTASGFYISAFFAPEHGGYNLENDEVNQYDNKDKILGREKNEFSFTTGMMAGHQLNKNLSIESGLSFSSSKISIDKSKIFAQRNNSGDIKFRYNTSSGYGFLLPSFNISPLLGDSLSTSYSNLILEYAGIPLSIKYAVGKGKYKFGIGAGVSVNFLTRSLVETEVKSQQNAETEIITRLEGLRKINVSFIISPEVQYNVFSKWAISARPFLKYSLMPINNRNIVKTYSYALGLGAGLTYKF